MSCKASLTGVGSLRIAFCETRAYLGFSLIMPTFDLVTTGPMFEGWCSSKPSDMDSCDEVVGEEDDDHSLEVVVTMVLFCGTTWSWSKAFEVWGANSHGSLHDEIGIFSCTFVSVGLVKGNDCSSKITFGHIYSMCIVQYPRNIH